MITPCKSCGNLMRPPRTHAADYPGTVARSSVLECGVCARSRKGGTTRQTREGRGAISGAQLEWALVEARRIRAVEEFDDAVRKARR